MKLSDIPVNTLDGIDKIHDRWPHALAWGAGINAMVFVMALGYESELFASLSIGALFSFLWVACLAGRPKK